MNALDLSKEFNPVPKPHSSKKRKIQPIKPGKKTIAWESAKSVIKKKFSSQGITTCELRLQGCWKNNALGFAHIDKRRYLTQEDLYKVVLACNPCHQQIEVMPRLEMRKLLLKIIVNRQNAQA